MIEETLAKLNGKKALIGVIGLGYIGLPLANSFSKQGFKVIGFEIDEEKINKLNSNKSYISSISNEQILEMNKNGFIPTSNFADVTKLDVIIICVPTPLRGKTTPDLRFILGTMQDISPYLKKGQILSLESTSYPGTTEEKVLPFLVKKNFNVGEDFYLVYSPEREDPGNKIYNTSNIPKVVSGISKNCLRAGLSLYENIVQTVPVSSTKTAEMTKLLENIYRSVNIGLVNELKIVADSMEIDIHEVIEAASTKPFGFTPFFPGPGLGGHCIPIDPYYLTWKAKKHGVDTKFIKLAGDVNTNIHKWILKKIKKRFKQNKIDFKKSRILILGAAYKKNVSDTRESPIFTFISKIINNVKQIDYHDPYVPKLSKTRKFNFNMKSINLSKKNLKKYDAVIILTDHDNIDFGFLKENSKLIVDTRGVYKGNFENVLRA